MELMDQMDMELRSILVSLFFLKPEQVNKFMPPKEGACCSVGVCNVVWLVVVWCGCL